MLLLWSISKYNLYIFCNRNICLYACVPIAWYTTWCLQTPEKRALDSPDGCDLP